MPSGPLEGFGDLMALNRLPLEMLIAGSILANQSIQRTGPLAI
jgi:hypothetical protein